MGSRLLSLVIVWGLAAPAWAQVEAWTSLYGGPEGLEDYGYSVGVDSKGNVYCGGGSDSSADGWDFLLVKFDADGNQLWADQWDGPGHGDDYGWIMRVDSQDCAVVAGMVTGPNGDYDIGVLKYDPAGNLLWSQLWDGPGQGFDGLSDQNPLEVDTNDNVIVAGTSNGGATGNDVVALKYAADGTLLWAKLHDHASGSSETGYGVRVDGKGRVYVGGTVNTAGNRDLLALQLSPDGDLLWASTFDGAGSPDELCYDIAIDSSRNVILTGLSETSAFAADFVTVKFDAQGSLLWSRVYDSPDGSYDLPFSVGTDRDGNIAVTGVSQQAFSGTTATVYYSPDGTEMWSYHHRGSFEWAGDNATFDVDFDAQGNLYVAGYVYMGAQDGFDATTLQFRPDGTLSSFWQYNGPGFSNDYGYGIFVHRGAIYLAGIAGNAAGSADLLVSKYETPTPFQDHQDL